jgi:predicted nucleotidyltransferase
MMKNVMLAVAMAATLGAASAQAGNYVEAHKLSPAEVIFGKNYDDNVTAIRVVGSGVRGDRDDRDDLPLQVVYPTGNSLRTAQGAVTEDENLSAALKTRKIATRNVLWVQTALNGGKIVYYR